MQINLPFCFIKITEYILIKIIIFITCTCTMFCQIEIHVKTVHHL